MPSGCINKRFVFTGLAEIVKYKNAPLRGVVRVDALFWCLLLAFMNPDGDDNFSTFCERLNNLVSMDAGPGGNVASHARIGAGHGEQVAIVKCLDLVLRANDGQRTEQSTGINLMFRHTSSLERH